MLFDYVLTYVCTAIVRHGSIYSCVECRGAADVPFQRRQVTRSSGKCIHVLIQQA